MSATDGYGGFGSLATITAQVISPPAHALRPAPMMSQAPRSSGTAKPRTRQITPAATIRPV